MNSSPPSSDTPLSAAELEEQLDELLEAAFTPGRRTDAIAAKLAAHPAEIQRFVLHWCAVTAQTHSQVAYLFARHVLEALETMDRPDVQKWLLHAMDLYDRQGLYPAIAVLKAPKEFTGDAVDHAQGVYLEEITGVLELFLRGLSGRAMKLEPADPPYTDTSTLFLPSRIGRFPEKEGNFRLYKAMAVHQWAQTHFGSFFPELAAQLHAYPDPDQARKLYHLLETVRLDAVLARHYPGLAREILALRGKPLPAEFQDAAAELEAPGAGWKHSLAWMENLLALPPPSPWPYMGDLLPERAEAERQQRLRRDKAALQAALAHMQPGAKPASFSLRRENSANEVAADFVLLADGRPVVLHDEVKGLLHSIDLDLGEIPPDYLTPAGGGGYAPAKSTKEREMAAPNGGYAYNEWDYQRRHYRKNWCTLRELPSGLGEPGYAAEVLGKYGGHVGQIRRVFEALRGEEKLLRAQKNGDNVDLDAAIAARTDLRCGREMTDRVFTRQERLERNIAVLFMVDMSGSTRGWINDAERESLLLMCEGLEKLGDRYAIYGFSGMTRIRCEIYPIKTFAELYGLEIQRRIAGIEPKDYTRMGAAIRHLTAKLKEVDARTRLLVTLSDGKPDDFNDPYRGVYGIEDTRMALIEAKRTGIHPFCITIDQEARDYLPHMYGAVNYTIVSEVRQLPIKVADIYRKLTT